jgi:iron complex transport system ATP-binding protein
VIELRAVTVELGGKPVVDGVSATVSDGEWLALIGPNGAGKTTLLRAMASLIPFSGEIALAGRRLGTLSGGEKQRVVVARALAQEAPIVLLDEPTASLDIGHQQQALELLDGLRADSGLTLVAAMHDLTLAAQYADRMLLLDAGRVVADGPPADVLTEALIAEHYGAAIDVVSVGDRLAVVPRRVAARVEQ